MDLQEDLCRDERRAHLVAGVVPRIAACADAALRAGLPVVFTQYWLPPDDPQFSRFGDTYCVEGTPGAEIIPELRELAERATIIRKRKHSAFYDTELEEVLRAADASTLGLAGLQTHICIMTTAADASFRGFDPVALEDCVVSSQATKKEAALDWIATYVGRVTSAQAFLEEAGVA
jgi:nicotinamidase-related amidase